MQSAQLDQCAATLDLTADVSPRPPMESGKLAVTCASTGAPGDPRMAQRQRHTAASCRSAYCRVWSGRIMRNQKFARVDVHIKRRSQQACVSCTEAAEDYLEKCANMKVDIEVLERLMEPENLDHSKVHPEVLDKRRQQYFPASHQRNGFVANRKRLESQGRNGAQQESGQNEWHDIEYQGVMAKVPPCPERTLKTQLPQESSLSSREEEGRWVAMEDRRRRSIAFEKMAKKMLKYLEDSDDVKVGITELQERLEISEKVSISIRQLAQQAMNENGQYFRNFQARTRKRHALPTAERSDGVGKKVSKHEAGSASTE